MGNLRAFLNDGGVGAFLRRQLSASAVLRLTALGMLLASQTAGSSSWLLSFSDSGHVDAKEIVESLRDLGVHITLQQAERVLSRYV